METHLTIGVGCCHGKAITKGVNQGKLSTREGLAVLIDLLDQHFIGNIDDHSQRFFRIEEGSIHIDLHIHLGREITSQRAGFHDTIAAVRNLFKGCDTAAVGSDGHQRGTVRANQAELHPRKRSLVLIALGNGEAGVVIPNGCGSSHNAIAIHSKGHDGIIQGITIRSVDLTEGIATGRHRNAGKPAVFIGGVTVDHFTLVVVYLDHSTRQGLFTGDVGLGEGYSAMYQIVVNGVNQNHTQHVLIRCLSVGGDGQIVAVSAHLPASLGLQLLNIVVAMRIDTLKGQHTIAVGCAGCHQRISHERTIGIGHVVGTEQAEHKTLAGGGVKNGLDAILAAADGAQLVDLLHQTDLRGQTIVADFHTQFHHGGMVIGIRQINQNGSRVEEIAFGSLDFHQLVFTQRQFLGSIAALFRGGDGVHHFTLLEPDGAILAGDGFGSTNLEDCTRQITFLVLRRMDFVTPGVLGFLEADQLQTGFVQ